MLDKRKLSRNSETDRYIQLANDFIVLAEKELSAFIRAITNWVYSLASVIHSTESARLSKMCAKQAADARPKHSHSKPKTKGANFLAPVKLPRTLPLKVKLQCELNQPRRPCRDDLPESRTKSLQIRIHKLSMVPSVKEL